MTKNIKKEIKKYLQTNENKDVMIQNLWNTVKAVLREKFMVINAYIKKKRMVSTKEPKFNLKKLTSKE